MEKGEKQTMTQEEKLNKLQKYLHSFYLAFVRAYGDNDKVKMLVFATEIERIAEAIQKHLKEKKQ